MSDSHNGGSVDPLTTEYECSPELKDALVNTIGTATIQDETTEVLELPHGLEAQRRSYTVVYDDESTTQQFSGYETIHPGGVFCSVEANIGFGAAFHLVKSLSYGVPTQSYIDESDVAGIGVELYQDLTTEWYSEVAVEVGMPEQRLENRGMGFEATTVCLEKLEDWAQEWIESR